jgi:hypothetical protein
MAATYLWVGAAVLGGWCLLLAALAYYISTSPDKRGRTAMGKLLPLAVRGRITHSHVLAHARHAASSALTHTFLVHARHACIYCMGAQALLSMLCSWVAAQIGPVQMRLADGLQVLCGAGMASTAAIMCAVLGWHAVTTHPLLLEALAHENGGAHLFWRSCACCAEALKQTSCITPTVLQHDVRMSVRRLAARGAPLFHGAAVSLLPAAQVCARARHRLLRQCMSCVRANITS